MNQEKNQSQVVDTVFIKFVMPQYTNNAINALVLINDVIKHYELSPTQTDKVLSFFKSTPDNEKDNQIN